MSKKFDKQFKENAVQYYHAHKELGWNKCAENLGISRNAIRSWVKAASENAGEVPVRGSGNYASDEEKENARLRSSQNSGKDGAERRQSKRKDRGKIHEGDWDPGMLQETLGLHDQGL